MDVICDTWANFENAAALEVGRDDKAVDGLPKYDNCRLLYAQCVLNDVNVDTVTCGSGEGPMGNILGDIFRAEDLTEEEIKQWAEQIDETL